MCLGTVKSMWIKGCNIIILTRRPLVIHIKVNMGTGRPVLCWAACPAQLQVVQHKTHGCKANSASSHNRGACRQLPLCMDNYTTFISRSAVRSSHENILYKQSYFLVRKLYITAQRRNLSPWTGSLLPALGSISMVLLMMHEHKVPSI